MWCERNEQFGTSNSGPVRSSGRQIRERVTRVPYCLHICRPTEDPDEDPAPVPLEEWRAAVAVIIGTRAQLHLTLSCIRAIHQTRFGHQRSLLLRRLGAVIRGDEGELYDLRTGQVIGT